MRITDVLVAPDVIVQACCSPAGRKSDLDRIVAHAKSSGCRLWQYSGAIAETARECAASGSQAQATLQQWADSFQWLAALAEDAAALSASDPSRASLQIALNRLGSGAVLITNHSSDDMNAECVQSPADFLQQQLDPPGIDFIDLRHQQDQIRPSLERGIFRVLRHGQYIMGPEVKELEEKLAEFVGVKHCVTVASGTDSLLIALMAWQIGPGDEVITVPYTWISTAEVISLLGARPVFVDIDAMTYNMDVDLLEQAITPRTKAIMPVSLYGQCCDMDRINEIAARYGIPVLEDAAQSFGATYKGRRSCGLSTVGSTSFFPSKPLGCYGDGGALFTDDDNLAELFRKIRVHGQQKKHHHDVIGINGRLDTMQAAIILAKFETFPSECNLRAIAGERYSRYLSEGQSALSVSPKDANRLLRPPIIGPHNSSVFAQYTIQSEHSDVVREHLQRHGIPCVSYYAVPLHLQPAFASLGHRLGEFPASESAATHGLSLPIGPSIGREAQRHIATIVLEALGTAQAVG